MSPLAPCQVRRDADIRTVLAPHLERAHPTGVLRHELGVLGGGRRVDLALIDDDHLQGWEIKADADTLIRLPDQATAYGRVFDHLTLVTTPRHLDAARRLLPTWWGLTVIQTDLDLRTLRAPAANPDVDGFALAQLLWRQEALEALRARGRHHGLSKARRWHIWQRLAQVATTAEIAALVRHHLRTRPEQPPTHVEGITR